jgi:hypothetical protein
MSTTGTGLSGEFYVLAQVAHRGLIGTLTLANNKGVDIIVYNEHTSRYWRVEVKTTRESPKAERVFGPDKFYSWQLSEKHEDIAAPDLVYIFVHLSEPTELPSFFVVPSDDVAKYVAWEHQHWLAAPHKNPVKSTSMRRFRVQIGDPNGYKANWALFDTASPLDRRADWQTSARTAFGSGGAAR